MKSKIKRHSRSVLAVILTLSMLVSCMMVGLIATDAARVTDSGTVGATVDDDSDVGGYKWTARNIFFRAPDGWDLSTYPKVQVWAVQSTDAGSGNKYAYLLCNMEIVGTTSNSRLYWGSINAADHSNWSDEYIAFTANISNWDTGDFYISTCGQYTKPYNYGVTSNTGSTTYLFSPSDAANNTLSYNNEIIGNTGTNKDVLKKNQTFHVITDGAASATGGSVDVTAHYVNPDSSYYSGSDVIKSSDITVDSNDTNATQTYENAVEGTKVTLTAKPDTGFTFAGYYDAQTGGNLISSNAKYSYYVLGTKNIYARFTLDTSSTYTIYVKKTFDTWSNINIYTYTGTTPKQGNWPGTQIVNNNSAATPGGGVTVTKDEKTGVYTVTGLTPASKVIFNNGDSTSGQEKQSASVDLEDGKLYTIKQTVDGAGNREVVVDDYGTASKNYYVIGARDDGTSGIFSNAWGKGDNGNWNLSSTDRMTGSGTTRTLTIESPTAGTYYFKGLAVETSNGTTTHAYIPGGESDTTNLSVTIPSGATLVTFTLTINTSDVSQSTLTAAVTMPSGDDTQWPPSDIDISGATDNCYIRYVNSNSSNDFAKLDSTNIKTKRPVYNNSEKYWWFDLYDSTHTEKGFGDVKSMLSGSNNIYYSLANDVDGTGSDAHWYDHIWHDSQKPSVNTGSTGINSGVVDKDSSKYFVGLYSIPSNATHVGVKITDNGTKYSYTYYITTSSGGDDTVSVVDIYAKNACVRDNTFNRFTHLANTDVVEVKVPNAEGTAYTTYNPSSSTLWTNGTWDNDTSGYSTTYAKLENVPVGSVIKIRTYLKGDVTSNDGSFDGTAFKDTHYLKAYSINGMTYKLHTASEMITPDPATSDHFTKEAYYEEDWTVQAVNTSNMKNGKTIEITPIYYLKNNANTKTFFIDGYIGELQNNWGTLLAVYPYYEGKSNKANAFGGYPGQPMLYWGGKYQMEIPLTVDGTSSGAQVKGLTLHNAYWDLLHRDLDPKCNTGHRQTYDYDDFYKLYKEKSPDTIYFWFKYRNQNDNYKDGYNYTGYTPVKSSSDTGLSSSTTISAIENRNGAEIVTDYYGRQVDLFGTVLSDSAKSTYNLEDGRTKKTLRGNELLLVSTGYKDTYVGEYATIWAVYEQSSVGNFTFKGYISSSMLYLNKIENVANYTDGTSKAQGRMSWSEFTNTYTYLKNNCQGVPAIISYEREIWNNTKDKANRSDGKWFYSFNNERIQAKVKIQYTNLHSYNAPGISSVTEDASNGWKTDDFSTTLTGTNGENNIGDTTKNSAYFTNTSPVNILGKTDSGLVFVDNNDHFTFQAQAADGYEFAGWVRENGGEYNEITSVNGLGQSNISANDTYIARFVKAQSGSLVISHNVVTNDQYTGTGSKDLTVVVKEGNTVKETIKVTDGSDVDISKWIKTANNSYTITVTATTAPSDSSFNVAKRETNTDNNTFKLTAGEKEAGATLEQSTTFTVEQVLSAGITALRYTTYVSAPNIGYQYKIKYTYHSRFWDDQSYTVSGTIPKKEAAQYFTGKETGARLLNSVIVSKTPYEKNFRQSINWNYTNITGEASTKDDTPFDTSYTETYTITANVGSTFEVDDKVKAEFLLPYVYTSDTKAADPIPVYDGDAQTEDKTIYFDEKSNESFKLTNQAGHLFTYDNKVVPTDISKPASQYNLVEAAPYVYKNVPTDYIYYTHSDDTRYYTGVYDESWTDSNTAEYTWTSEEDAAKFVSYQVDKTQTGLTRNYKKAGIVDNGQLIIQITDDQYTVTKKTDKISGLKKGYQNQIGVEQKFFTRWDIYTTDGLYVASSYSRRFNYSGYEDYVVIPKYESQNDTAINNPGGIYTSITYMGDGRNQWNSGDMGDYYEVTNKKDGDTAADKILIDFALAYNNNGQQITIPDENVKVGLVIERLGKIQTTAGADVNKMGQTDAITDLSYYAKLYNTTGNDYLYEPSQITTYVQGKISDPTNYKIKPSCCSGAVYCLPKKIDNFNRLQYTYTFTHSSGTVNAESDRDDAMYVYRATSFIYVNGESTPIALSAAPVYFTLYDIASR